MQKITYLILIGRKSTWFEISSSHKAWGVISNGNANPESDLFLVAHRGFEAFGSFKEISQIFPL
ncbi:MAG: hypothetical protein Ct9H90mP5_06220 [Acidimicrobiaceae bacterium]|nr:MAG: hypothetical protein Ct9H90mP5_06220 [Acidimicrobiaceae bacterium]